MSSPSVLALADEIEEKIGDDNEIIIMVIKSIDFVVRISDIRITSVKCMTAFSLTSSKEVFKGQSVRSH